MAEEAPASASTNKSKESETLCKSSLIQLARGLGKEPGALTLPMLLNLPTITIINLIHDNNNMSGLLSDNDGSLQTAVVEKCLLLWRQYTKDQKNKERMKTLEKALREMGKNELCDTIADRYANHQEITPDVFA